MVISDVNANVDGCSVAVSFDQVGHAIISDQTRESRPMENSNGLHKIIF